MCPTSQQIHTQTHIIYLVAPAKNQGVTMTNLSFSSALSHSLLFLSLPVVTNYTMESWPFHFLSKSSTLLISIPASSTCCRPLLSLPSTSKTSPHGSPVFCATTSLISSWPHIREFPWNFISSLQLLLSVCPECPPPPQLSFIPINLVDIYSDLYSAQVASLRSLFYVLQVNLSLPALCPHNTPHTGFFLHCNTVAFLLCLCFPPN